MNSYSEVRRINLLKIPKWAIPAFSMAFLIFQVILIIVFADKGLVPIIILFLALIVFICTAFSVDRTYYLFALYVAVAPNSIYLSYFPGITIYYWWRFAFLFFGLLLFYWVIYLSKNPQRADFRSLDYAIIVYLVLVFLSAIRGFLFGFQRHIVLWDLSPHLWYLCYFIFRYSPLKSNLRKFFDIILFYVVIVGLEFIYGFSQAEGFIFLRRIVSRNIHLALFAIPYIGATIIYGTKLIRKIVLTLLLPIILAAVFFSQQRSLWFAAFSTLIILGIIFMYSRRRWIVEHTKKLLVMFATTILTIVIIFFIFGTQVKEELFITTLSRILVFIDPSLIEYDTSWLVRGKEIAAALESFPYQFLLGSGFGDSIVSPLRPLILISPDNAYVYLLWKMGIVGLSIFIIIHLLFIKRCFMILFRTESPDHKIFALTGLLNTFGLMIVGFANACISQYQFLVIWTAIIAAIEIIARQYE